MFYQFKHLLAVILLLTLFSTVHVSLEATAVRTSGMGLADDEGWVLSGRIIDIYRNPAYMLRYSDRAYFEYESDGTTSDSLGALFLSFGDNLSFGVYAGLPVNTAVFNRNDTPRSFFYDNEATAVNHGMIYNQTNSYTDIDTAIVTSNGLAVAESNAVFSNARNDLTTRNITALASFQAGLEYGISAGFGRAADTQIREKDNISEQLSLVKEEYSFGAGLIYDKSSGVFKGADVSAEYRIYRLSNVYDETDGNGERVNTRLESDGAGDLFIKSSTDLQVFNKHLFHFYFEYAMLNSSTTGTAQSTISTGGNTPFYYTEDFTRNGHRFTGGFSDEITLNRSLIWFLSVKGVYEQLENNFDGKNQLTGALRDKPVTQKFNLFYLPLSIGVEAILTESLLLRFGFGHSLKNRRENNIAIESYSSTTELSDRDNSGTVRTTTITEKSGSAGAVSTAAFGLSYRFDRFTVDWNLNINFLVDGPRFVSGAVNDVSSAIALTYAFRADRVTGMNEGAE